MSETPEQSRLRLSSASGVIELVDESSGSERAPDSARLYQRELVLGEGGFSRLGVMIDDQRQLRISAPGGPTTVHNHSAFVREGRLYCAVGDHAACLSLNGLEIEWAVQVDTATCFGLHPIDDAIICHGELEISRLSLGGELVWQVSGRDIFTGDFTLEADWIAARDWNDNHYRITYDGTVLEPPR